MFRWISIGFIAASLLLWLFFALSSEPLELVLEEAPELKEETPMQVKGLELYEYKDDQEHLRIFATDALIYEQREASFLENVSAIVYEEGRKQPTFIKSNRASMDGKSKLVTLKGEVELGYGKDATLSTAVLFYDQKTDKIYNRHPVLVKRNRDQVRARKMEYDLKKGVLILDKPILQVYQ